MTSRPSTVTHQTFLDTLRTWPTSMAYQDELTAAEFANIVWFIIKTLFSASFGKPLDRCLFHWKKWFAECGCVENVTFARRTNVSRCPCLAMWLLWSLMIEPIPWAAMIRTPKPLSYEEICLKKEGLNSAKPSNVLVDMSQHIQQTQARALQPAAPLIQWMGGCGWVWVGVGQVTSYFTWENTRSPVGDDVRPWRGVY